MSIKKFDTFLNEEVDPDSTEAYTELILLDKVLKPLIEYCKKMYTKEAQAEGKMDNNQVLGMIVSKFCRWDPNDIIEVSAFALEDANQDDLAEKIRKL